MKPTSDAFKYNRQRKNVVERGATLGEVRDQLGHADINTTSLYVHSSAETSTTRLLKIV